MIILLLSLLSLVTPHLAICNIDLILLQKKVLDMQNTMMQKMWVFANQVTYIDSRITNRFV